MRLILLPPPPTSSEYAPETLHCTPTSSTSENARPLTSCSRCILAPPPRLRYFYQSVHSRLRGLRVRAQLRGVRVHGGVQAAEDARLHGLRVPAVLQDRAHHRDLHEAFLRAVQRGLQRAR